MPRRAAFLARRGLEIGVGLRCLAAVAALLWFLPHLAIYGAEPGSQIPASRDAGGDLLFMAGIAFAPVAIVGAWLLERVAIRFWRQLRPARDFAFVLFLAVAVAGPGLVIASDSRGRALTGAEAQNLLLQLVICAAIYGAGIRIQRRDSAGGRKNPDLGDVFG